MPGFVFVFFSIFPIFPSPIAVVGGGRGGQHPHITLPHLVVSAIPTLDLPRLEAVRPSAYIDKAEPIYLLKDFKPCSVIAGSHGWLLSRGVTWWGLPTWRVAVCPLLDLQGPGLSPD